MSIAFILAQVSGVEGTYVGQGIIATMAGAIAFFGKRYLDQLVEEIKKMRISLDRNTHLTTVSLLQLASLQPGAQPMLERIKTETGEDLKKEGQTL